MTDEPQQPTEYKKTVDLIPFQETDEPILYTEPVDTKSSINVDITTTTTLFDFVIDNILIIPSQSATINITIRTSHLPLKRVVILEREAYFAWSSDDNYIYDYIRENIHTIY